MNYPPPPPRAEAWRRKLVFGITFLIPVLFGFFLVTAYGVNVFYGDEWAAYPLFFDDVLQHGVRLQTLFLPHGQHSFFFPKLLFLLSLITTQLNTKMLMYCSWLFVSCAYFIVMFYISRSIERGTGLTIKGGMLALLTGFSFFNFVEHDIFLWGFESAWALIVLAAVAAFYFFARFLNQHNFSIILILLFVIVGAFSSMQGLFIVPAVICVCVLLALSKEKQITKPLLGFTVAAALIAGIYWYILQLTNSSSSLFHISSIPKVIAFFFVVVGSPFIPRLYSPTGLLYRYPVAEIVELVLAVLLLCYLIRTKRLPVKAIAVCAVFIAASVCAGLGITWAGGGSAETKLIMETVPASDTRIIVQLNSLKLMAGICAAVSAGVLEIIVSMMIIIYLVRRKRVLVNAFPLCLVFFGFLVCLVTALGRIESGLEQALSPRYALFALCATIGLVLIVYREFIQQENIQQSGNTVYKPIAILGLSALFILLMNQNITFEMPARSLRESNKTREIVLTYKDQPPEALEWATISLKADEARRIMAQLEQRGWSVFARSHR